MIAKAGIVFHGFYLLTFDPLGFGPFSLDLLGFGHLPEHDKFFVHWPSLDLGLMRLL